MKKKTNVNNCVNQLTVVQADITDVAVDAIVHPTNNSFYLGGEVGSAISRAGGQAVCFYCCCCNFLQFMFLNFRLGEKNRFEMMFKSVIGHTAIWLYVEVSFINLIQICLYSLRLAKLNSAFYSVQIRSFFPYF